MKKIVIFLCCMFLALPYIKASETLKVSEEFETTVKEESSSINLAEKAKSAILIEVSTGEVLFEKNSHEKLAPASMTKIMSMLLIMESIEKGIINWNDKITASENASSMGGSQILLETGEQMKVEDLFKGIAVASGNDAVVALAEAIAGTEEEFVRMMNDRAKELGLKDTNFKNPHGLDDADHYSSAYDMAMIAKELVKHEKVLEFSSIYEDYLRKGTDKEFWLVNTNKLVRFYNGVDGLKTGYTTEAGYCLTATAKKNDMRLISVVMGEDSNTSRNAETTSMLDYGFAQYKIHTLLTKNNVVREEKIEKGKDETVEVTPTEDITILTRKKDGIGEITYDVKLNNVKAPIKKGDVIGRVTVKEDGKTIKKIDLTVKKNVEKANLLDLFLRYLDDIVNGNITF